MPTQQQEVSSRRVQLRQAAAQPIGAEANAVMHIRENSMPQAKMSVAADLSPIALTNLSPDSFFGSYQDPQNRDGSLGPYSNRYYVYKANDTLIIGGANGAATVGAYLDVIPGGNNVSIQATNLLIATSISIEQADVQIYCRHLAIPAGVTVTINVSAQGKAPADGDSNMAKAAVNQAAEGQPGQDGSKVATAWAQDISNKVSPDPFYGPPIDYPFGQNGENAGSITIICDELQLDGTLILHANGRNGYSGCPGQQGGSVATGQTAGQGGDGQVGGWGGNGGAVTVQYRTLTSGNAATGLEMNANGGQPGLAGTPGTGGSPNGATGGSPPGSLSGTQGSTSVSTFTDVSLLGQAFDEIYLLKAVETAKLQYMLNEPTAFSSAAPADTDGYKAVKDTLVWLQSMLSGYATLGGNPTDSDQRKNNLYLIACTYCTRISCVPPLTSAGNLASSIPGWMISTPAQEQNGNILQWIEETYLSDGKNTLSKLKKTCADYMTAFNTLMKDEVTAEKIQAQYQAYEEAAASYQASCDSLCAMLDPSDQNSIAGQLSLASQTLLDDFETLQPILGQVQTTIANHFDCNVQNVLTTLSQAVPQMLFMASDPALMAPMAAASALPLIQDGITQITDNSGNAIQKSQIITDLKVVKSNGQDFINDVKGDLLDSSGNLNNNTTYVLSQLSTLNDDISSLSGSIDNDNKDTNGNPTPVAEQAVAAIEALKQAIITKSQLQLQYQSYAAAAATAWQNYEDAKTRADQIKNTDPAKMPTPDLLGHVSHLAMLYQKGLTDFIAFSSQFKRFAAWLSLDNTDDPDLTQMATTLNSYWSQGSAPQPSDLDTIDANLGSYEDKLSAYFQNQSSPAFATPANPQNPQQPDPTQKPTDLFISITADCILNLVRQGVPQSVSGKGFQYGTPVTFMIVPFGLAKQWGVRRGSNYPPVTNSDGTTTYFYRNDNLGLVGIPMVEYSQSGNFYDLRAYYVQPRITGATYKGTLYSGTTPQSILVGIHAPATRWFWSSDESQSASANHLIFTHPNFRTATFKHYCLTPYDVSGSAGELSDASLSPLGIYGPWTIRLLSWALDTDPNAQIDFASVTEIQLGFAGMARNISVADEVRRGNFAGHAAS
jgi:hypothetical protein